MKFLSLYFFTGDGAQFIENSYKILGRSSVDILKTGGYKVSAVQVESTLMGHPDILDCSVVGLPDKTWGQKVSHGDASENVWFR